MNLIPQASPPILGRPQLSILNEMVHHCVRFHKGFLTGVGHPVLLGSTVRHIRIHVFSEKGSFCGPCAGWNQSVLRRFLFSLLSSLLQSKNPAIAATLPCYHQHYCNEVRLSEINDHNVSLSIGNEAVFLPSTPSLFNI